MAQRLACEWMRGLQSNDDVRSAVSRRRDRKPEDSLPAQSSDRVSAQARFTGSFWIEPGRGTGNPTSVPPCNALSQINAPGLDLSFDPRHVRLVRNVGTVIVVCGVPKSRNGEPLDDGALARKLSGGQSEALDSWLSGRFSIVQIDLHERRILFITDRFAVYPICLAVTDDRIDFSNRVDAVPVGDRKIDPQSIFEYVYFHVIPAPRTIFREVQRLEAATRLQVDKHGSGSTRWWRPVFAADADFRQRDAAEEFRGLVRSAVKGAMRSANVGAYLSGGTDSSTVAGMLGLVSGRPPRTYSIGFGAEGYDEMTYARIAASHFGTEHHELYVGPEHVAQGIPIIASGYDQPFGNSSALPAYFCAKMARDDGVQLLLAGDGGDELFGGNVRYARQKVLDAYSTLPQSLRQAVIEPMLFGAAWPRRLPLAGKVKSYVEQARVPMPARTETYNQLHRIGVHSVLSAELLAAVDTERPNRLQKQAYEEIHATSLVDRMLGYDWRFTLTDNDLPKVSVTAALAGIDVEFPLLDDALVDFSLRLPAKQKVRRLRLRHFFKNSMKGFLPDEILRKKKHGFGLPIGPWLLSEPGLLALSKRAVDGLVARRLVRAEFAGELFSDRLGEHAGLYGEMVWVLLMLEHWLQVHADKFALDS